MVTTPLRRALGVVAVLVATTAVSTGCVVTVGSGEQPKVELTCPRHVITVALTNTSASGHRYTVTVDVGHDGMQEDFLLSSELVPAGGHAELTETVLTEEPITCKLKGVQAFAG
jgi:hypothetical protein